MSGHRPSGMLWHARLKGAAAIAAVALVGTGAQLPAHAEVPTPPSATATATATEPTSTEPPSTEPGEPTPGAETPPATEEPTTLPSPTTTSRAPAPPRARPPVPLSVPTQSQAVLRAGITSGFVAELQRLLDANTSRDYFGDAAAGPYSTLFLADTEAALKAWQSAQGLTPTGIITTGSPQWQRLQGQATRARTSTVGATLARGTTSALVRTLQAALHNNTRGSQSSMFTTGVYDSYFGPEVEAGLKRWQSAHGLSQTGTIAVGSAAWTQLLQSQGPLAVSLRNPGQLKPGATGSSVTVLQSMLDRNSLQDYQPHTNGVYDTFFGPSTATGLKQVQSRLGYVADGVIEVGSLEWGHLASLATVAKTGKAGTYLRWGTVHSDVLVAQRMLDQNSQRDYFGSSSVGGYTTTYGSLSANGMRAWQTANGYPANGVITVNSIQWGHLASQLRATPRLDPRCYTNGVVLCASKSLRKTFYVNKGVIIRELDARFGGLAYSTTGVLRTYNTAEGTFSITRKIRDEVSYTYNNTPMPFSMYFYQGQAFHYSYGFAANGYSGNMGSHGCVNLRDWAGAQWLYNNTPVGTKVVIYK